jgi:glycosyltransferase involved in cell wall biosynthesis
MTKAYSIVIITKNETQNIGNCLKALEGLSDDIVVIDAESSDKTVTIAESLGARVFIESWQGYGPAKNLGITKCKNDWIISIDADEYISPQLKRSLLDLKLDEKCVYALNILPNYCGRWIKYGTWHPDWNIRVFNRKEVSWNNNKVHEQLIGLEQKQVIRLKGTLDHYSYRTIDEHLSRIDDYALLSAKDYIKTNRTPGLLKRWFGPAFRFIKYYIIRLGFLDGYYGFIIAKIEALMVHKRNLYYKNLSK